MLPATGNGVYSGRVHVAVAQNVSQLGNVPVLVIVTPGKKVSQIMRKDFVRVYFGLGAEFFHFCPNVAAIHRLPTSRYKDGPAGQAALLNITKQFTAELVGQKHGSDLSL